MPIRPGRASNASYTTLPFALLNPHLDTLPLAIVFARQSQPQSCRQEPPDALGAFVALPCGALRLQSTQHALDIQLPHTPVGDDEPQSIASPFECQRGLLARVQHKPGVDPARRRDATAAGAEVDAADGPREAERGDASDGHDRNFIIGGVGAAERADVETGEPWGDEGSR